MRGAMRRQAAYGLAIATVAVATLLTRAIRVVRHSSPFLLFTIAVMASAALGGFGPGILAVLLSGVAAVYFLFEPTHSFRIADPANSIPLALFGVVGVAITWGVTLLTRARQQAEENRERFHSAFADSHIGFVLTDTRGGMMEVNRAFCEITGYAEHELLGKQVRAITHPEDIEESARLFDQVLRRRRRPDRRVLTRLAVPRCVLLSHEPARFVLKPIQRAGEDRALLVPDYLLVMDEPDPQQAIEHFPREPRGVPHVGDLETGDEFEGVRPIGPRVAADRGFGMARCAVLHVARFGMILPIGRGASFRLPCPLAGKIAAVQAGTVTPLAVQLDSVRRVSNHQQRLAVAKQPCDRFTFLCRSSLRSVRSPRRPRGRAGRIPPERSCPGPQ